MKQIDLTAYNRFESVPKDEEMVDNQIEALLASMPGQNPDVVKIMADRSTYQKARLSIFRVLSDRRICVGCQNYFSCPKKGRRGSCYRLTESQGDFGVKGVMCERKAKYNFLAKQIIYTDRDPEILLGHGQRLVEVAERLKSSDRNARSSFQQALLEVLKTVKNKSDQTNIGLGISCPNSNAISLAGFAIHRCAFLGLKIAVVDIEKTVNTYGLSNDSEDFSELLDLIRPAEVHILLNLDRAVRRVQIRDAFLIPLLQLSLTDGKLCFITSSTPFEQALSFGENQSYNRRLIELVNSKIEEIAVTDPPLFKL